ncbi:E3 ubiquitin-protein ligase rnf126 [Phtheirospermum japonicum]|uniref:RING-type E3 ubiquitin transferase n=1 Tax=Phtheirospermum japonicum TaxID=374723 RepID=A0A830CJ76_9LAMI|nr:E3 ubiquitin-protein ligase rnf126 [Phtheirospermum japonicum]
MGSRSGYEHRYGFSTEDELISLYNREALVYFDNALRKHRFKGFVFEIRTRFLLKTILEAHDCGGWLELDIYYRLFEYWMAEDEIYNLAREAFDFAKRTAADNPKYASLDVVPVVIGLDVLTVQLEGETVNDAHGRAIRPECLIPMNMCPMAPFLSPFRPPPPSFLLELPTVRVRVEDVDHGLALMEACPICFRVPTIGAQMSSLPCKHVFHNHCVVHWLLMSKSCPLCRYEIVV